MVSFFNDVDVSMEAAWVPAVQYLGTRGFFDSYDAAPEQPLELGVARAWAGITASLLAGQADASTADAAAEAGIRAVTAARAADPSPVTATGFVAMLEGALRERGLDDTGIRRHLPSAASNATSTLTRAEACVLVYGLLADGPG